MKASRYGFKGALVLALLFLTACASKANSGALLLGGDVMLARGGMPIFSTEEEQGQPWGLIEKPLVREEDALFMVNLESPLGRLPAGLSGEEKKMNLCADPMEIRVLQKGGIDLVTRANNHANDCQAGEVSKSNQLLTESGIEIVATGEFFKFVEWQGKTVAILALDDILSPVITKDYVDKFTDARERSDLVVISIHWGGEYQAGPSARQLQLAGELTDAGADLIWGHHPHVLQKMEWLTSTTDGHTALVIYSLGNLLADQWALPRTQITVLARVTFSQHEITGIRLIPFRMKPSTRQLHIIWDRKTRAWVSDRLNLEELDQPGVRVILQSY